MASNPPLDLVLKPTRGKARSVREWLTTFHLVLVAVDPGNTRSGWIVPTAARILSDYDQADCRVAWLVAGDDADARRFLGRWATEILTFTDPDLVAISGFGLATLPAIVHLGMDGQVVNAVEGWDPPAWRALTVELSRMVDWTRPSIPGPRDPGPFLGAPIPAR
ncbi:MAG: hypothetical protein ACRD0Q_06835 [Acidimicrobiales bacterium]